MAGTLHQGIIALFQEDPWLAFDVLGIERPVHGDPIDRRSEIERAGKEPIEFRPGFPDLVLVAHDTADPEQGLVITIEVQKGLDSHKRWMIPVYQSHLAEQHELETWAVVVSLSERVSKAMRDWQNAGPPRVDALLLDVDTVPKSPWLDDPARRPMAALLAAAMHGYAGDFDAARRGFQLVRSMTGKRRWRHGMTILSALPKHQRDQLLKELPMHEQHDWMDVERRSGTYQFGVEEGRAEGRAAIIELIFEVLADRGLVVDAASEARIRSCDDLSTLRRWARQAIDVPRVDALLETYSDK